MQSKKTLNHNAKRSLIKGFVIGIITIIIYLLVVAFTTPNLSSIDAIFGDTFKLELYFAIAN